MKKLIMKLLGKRKTSLGFKVKDLEIFPSKRKYLAAQHDYSMLGRDIVFKDEGETRMGVVVKDYISSDLSRHYTTINRVTGEESDVDIHNVFKDMNTMTITIVFLSYNMFWSRSSFILRFSNFSVYFSYFID